MGTFVSWLGLREVMEDSTDDDQTELGAFVCSHVFTDPGQVLYVVHDPDGHWQFLCGGTHRDQVPRLVGIRHLLEHEPALRELSDLPIGWQAERSSSRAPWRRSALG